jgi:hypothetical protein
MLAMCGIAMPFGFVMPLFYFGHSVRGHLLWAVVVVPPVLALQLWLSRRLMTAAMWPYTCRALAANGYEVCPRCAYPLRGASPDNPLCPECGAPRCTSAPSADVGGANGGSFGRTLMTRKELEQVLIAKGVRADRFDLKGGHLPERYTLARRKGKWWYYYSERGDETGLQEFGSESLACEYLLAEILRDPANRC